MDKRTSLAEVYLEKELKYTSQATNVCKIQKDRTPLTHRTQRYQMTAAMFSKPQVFLLLLP